MTGSSTSDRCPRCGWPTLAEGGAARLSRHATSAGQLSYLRCVCGARLVVLAGRVLGAAGAPARLSFVPRREDGWDEA